MAHLTISRYTAVTRTVAGHAKTAIHNRKLHHRVFAGALVIHLTHVMVSAPSVNSFEAALSWFAAAATVAMHVTESPEDSNESHIREIIAEEYRRLSAKV